MQKEKSLLFSWKIHNQHYGKICWRNFLLHIFFFCLKSGFISFCSLYFSCGKRIISRKFKICWRKWKFFLLCIFSENSLKLWARFFLSS
jgi:hypothetical protein